MPALLLGLLRPASPGLLLRPALPGVWLQLNLPWLLHLLPPRHWLCLPGWAVHAWLAAPLASLAFPPPLPPAPSLPLASPPLPWPPVAAPAACPAAVDAPLPAPAASARPAAPAALAGPALPLPPHPHCPCFPPHCGCHPCCRLLRCVVREAARLTLLPGCPLPAAAQQAAGAPPRSLPPPRVLPSQHRSCKEMWHGGELIRHWHLQAGALNE